MEVELNHLERQGIINKVVCSNWAALIVVVPKGDKLIHICRDYKVNVNPYVRQRSYRSVNC